MRKSYKQPIQAICNAHSTMIQAYTKLIVIPLPYTITTSEDPAQISEKKDLLRRPCLR